MDRINSANTITVGGKRKWQDKNVAAGIAGTQFVAVYENDVQEELVAGFIERVGFAPAAGTLQVGAAADQIYGAPPIYVLASENVGVPQWATRCHYKLWGGGASGCASPGATARGAGGGAGGYCEGVATGLTAGQVIPMTVGSGGAATTSTTGNPGGTTSMGSIASATGGSAPSIYAGGFSGVGVGGTINAGLGDGGDGCATATQPGGDGGGAGGRGATAAGQNGRGPGGGGGGCPTSFSAGAGAGGLAILEFLP